MLDQAANVESEFHLAPEPVRTHLCEAFRQLVNRPDIDECIYVHLEPRFAPGRTQRIQQIMSNLLLP